MTILSKIHVDYKQLFKGNPVLPSSGQHSSDYKLYMKTTFVSVDSCLLCSREYSGISTVRPPHPRSSLTSSCLKLSLPAR